MKLPSRFLFLLLAAILANGAPRAFAQKPLDQASASERTLISIKATGSKRYSEDAIVAASGLQIGSSIVEDDFKKAALRLGAMGVFSDVGYTFSYSSAGTKLEFHVTDAEKFAQVRFEDFVWFSDLDLLSRIKDGAPLFNGTVPVSGRLADQISDVLQAMLVENGIPGHVDYVRAAASEGQPDAIVYSVSDVVIQVRNFEFNGAGEAELPALQEAAKSMPGRDYSRTRLEALVQHQLLPVYHARGYLKAAFGDPQPKVVKMPSADSNEVGLRHQTIVDVTFAVTPGPQYKLKNLEWSGNQEFPSDVLQKMVRAEPGEPVNTIRLSDNLKDIQKLYGSKGYVTATLKTEATYDATSMVVIRIDVKEGAVYHMGDLEFRGLDNSLTAKLRNAWKIRQGDVYDATYLSEYLPSARKLLPSTLDWDVSSHVTANVREKTVDVDLIYSVKAPK
jgi:outer membrane protein assembly factor BamA